MGEMQLEMSITMQGLKSPWKGLFRVKKSWKLQSFFFFLT